MKNSTVNFSLPTLLLASAVLLAACGGDGPQGDGTADTTAPSLTSQAPTTRVINNDQSITLVFDESMDSSSFTLAGDLVSESNGGIWSQTNEISDTLTLSPTSTWSINTNRDLTANVQDLAGNSIAVNVVYDIYNGTLYYVDASQTDNSGNGLSPATAKKDLHIAMASATAPATILVNAGEYDVNNVDAKTIVVREGISLYGGFSADFTSRDPASDTSTIVDNSQSDAGNENIAILASGAITTSTIIDGFTITGSTSIPDALGYTNNTYAIHVISNAAPTIQNNTINGGSGAGTAGNSAGIRIDSASPVISANTIDGGTGVISRAIRCSTSSNPIISNNTINGGGGTATSDGIRNESGSAPVIENNSINAGTGSSSAGVSNNNSSPIIRANTIHGGDATVNAFGIYNAASSPSIYNNEIYGGDDTTNTHGIHMTASSSPTIRNNTIHGGEGTTNAFGIHISDTGSSPFVENNIVMTRAGAGSSCQYKVYNAIPITMTVKNNALAFCSVNYRFFNTFNEDFTASTVNGLGTLPNHTGNLTQDPLFVELVGTDGKIGTLDDNDWRLSASTPSSVSAGGINGIDQAWSFTTDKDDATRPASGTPWAIGAYEP